MMASTVADNVSRPVAPLSAKPSRNLLRLRARRPIIASAYTYAVPFHARFEPGQALLSDGSPMPDGCGTLGFVAPFTSRHAEIEPVPASMHVRISLPEADFEALWSTLATGRPDLVATLRFSAGPFEHVLPPGRRWNTTAESNIRVVRGSIAFTGPGWPGRGCQL